MTPQRIQRNRAKGWAMPPNTVYVGRPTKYGNPYAVGHNMPAETCVRFYHEWLRGERHNHGRPTPRDIEALRGKNLACWCRLDQPCHADVLLRIANGYDEALVGGTTAGSVTEANTKEQA